MGKTIQMISLLVSNISEKPNLIVCPAVALMQWYISINPTQLTPIYYRSVELEKRVVPGLLKVLIFHGNNRIKNKKELLQYNVILTTYSIVEQGFRKENYGTKKKGFLIKERSLLHSIDWDRFILDEAHSIKDRYCSTARACFAIKSQYQWCLSGTPLQNRVGELFSLIRLLNIYPHSYYFCRRCPCKMQSWKFSDHIYCDECGHTGESFTLVVNVVMILQVINTFVIGMPRFLNLFKSMGLLVRD